MSWNEDAALRSAWRRIFTRSPIVIEVLKAGKRYVPKFNTDGSKSKKDSVEYLCNVCKKWVKASVGGKNNIAVDHIIPVIAVDDVSGKVKDWNVFKTSLFCVKSNLQIICKSCHLIKSNSERDHRNALKDKYALDALILEISVLMTIGEAKRLKKAVTKYTTKTKSDITRKRAKELRDKLIYIIEKED